MSSESLLVGGVRGTLEKKERYVVVSCWTTGQDATESEEKYGLKNLLFAKTIHAQDDKGDAVQGVEDEMREGDL